MRVKRNDEPVYVLCKASSKASVIEGVEIASTKLDFYPIAKDNETADRLFSEFHMALLKYKSDSNQKHNGIDGVCVELSSIWEGRDQVTYEIVLPEISNLPETLRKIIEEVSNLGRSL